MPADLLRMDDYLAKSLTRPAAVDGGGASAQAIDPVVLASLDEAWDEGEADLVVELIDLYLGDAPQWVEAIRTAAAENDATVLKRAAHTLKGSSGSLGIRQVAEVCGMLELIAANRLPESVSCCNYWFKSLTRRARPSRLSA